MNLMAFIIPGFSRNPVFSQIAALPGMTALAEIHFAAHKCRLNPLINRLVRGSDKMTVNVTSVL
jgi:hypothetical protein